MGLCHREGGKGGGERVSDKVLYCWRVLIM